MDRTALAKSLVTLAKQLNAGDIVQDTPGSAVGRLNKIKAHINRSLMEIDQARRLLPVDFEDEEDETITVIRFGLNNAYQALETAMEDLV